MANELTVKIGLKINEFEKNLKQLKKSTEGLERGLNKTAKISGAAFVGLAGAITVASTKFAKFEKTFSDVVTLLDKSSFSTKTFEDGVKSLEKGVLSLSATSGQSLEVLNKGLFDLVSAGVDAEKSIEALTVATNLAIAGATDTSIAVDGLTSAINAYGLNAEDAQKVSEKFFLAQKFGKTTVEELAKGFGLVGSTASETGVKLDELLASVAAATKAGIRTKAAYTGLKAALANIIKPTEDARKEALNLGISFDQAALKTQGLDGFLDSIKNSANFSAESFAKLFGSVEAYNFVSAIAGKQSGAFKDQLKGLNNEAQLAATFQSALATKQATTTQAVNRATKAWEAITVQIGERFAPLITKVADGLSKFAKNFNRLGDEQKDSIASFIKWGALLTGAITGIALFASAILSLSAPFVALGGIMFATGTTAATMWGFIFGPITLGVAAVVGLTAAFVKLYQVFNLAPKKSLEELNRELEKLEKRKRQVNESTISPAYKSNIIKGVEKDIAALKKLKEEAIAASKDFGTGELLVRPVSDGTDPFAGLDTGLGQEESIFVKADKEQKAQEEANRKSLESQKAADAKKLEEKNKAIDAGTAATKEALKNEAELRQLANEGATQQEIEFAARQNDLDEQTRQAKLNKDETARAVELANIALHQEALTAQKKEYDDLKFEQDEINGERNAVLREELDLLTEEQRAMFNEKELEQLSQQVLTKEEVEKQAAKKQITDNLKRRNQFLKDEQKFGTTFAKFKSIERSEQFQATSKGADALAGLQNSSNSKMQEIGKAAARVQIGISTARGAMDAFASFAQFGPAGAALGAAAAGLVVAYGAEQQLNVGKAANGGFVPDFGGGSRDRTQMFLEPGELVVPKALTSDFIQSVGRPDNQKEESNETSQMVSIAIEDDAADFITAKQRENEQLAIGVL